MLAVCARCRLCLLVEGDVEDIIRLLDRPEWQISLPCVTPLCRGRAVKKDFLRNQSEYEVKPIRVEDYYKALHGLGLPTAPEITEELVHKLLLEKRIVGVEGELANPETPRFVVRCLVLEDGTRLHFALSSFGACIYYIESEVKHEGSDHSVRDLEGHDQDREEAGRGSGGVEESVAGDGADTVSLQGTGLPSVREEGGVPTCDPH